jgi:acyl-CoA synthetase (AMP-forming)/AMP-acid ligase II
MHRSLCNTGPGHGGRAIQNGRDANRTGRTVPESRVRPGAAAWARFVDRKKDMTIVSGLNVYLSGIAPVWPNVPASACPTVHGREQLTGCKMPRQVVFIDALPESTVGKILRRALRDVK